MSTQTKALTIVLGIGHGGSDPGACNGKRCECDDNLRLGLAIEPILKTQGHKVMLTRMSDSASTPEQRRQIAINMNADFFIDLHRDSFTDASAKGIEIWVSNSVNSQAAAEVLLRLVQIEHQANRNIKVGSYRVLFGNPMPSMLIELGFISNAKDNELYDKHLTANAEAIARGGHTLHPNQINIFYFIVTYGNMSQSVAVVNSFYYDILELTDFNERGAACLFIPGTT